MCAFCIPVSGPAHARPAVLLTPSISLRPVFFASCKQVTPVSPLFAAFAKSAHLYESMPLSTSLFSYTCALFCTFLHLPKAQSFCYQAIPHSLAKNTGVWGGGASCGEVDPLPHQSLLTNHDSPSVVSFLPVNILLNEVECRLLGSLIEKEITTPEYYPLSLNALVNARNQKSNRDPLRNLDKAPARPPPHSLDGQSLGSSATPSDSRATRSR